MKTLIVEMLEPSRLGELVTVSRLLGEDKPDLLAVGVQGGAAPGSFGRAFGAPTAVGANLAEPLAQWAQGQGYELILLSATVLGGSLAGHLAFRLGGDVVSEVVGVRLEDGQVVVERPVYGGKALATYQAKARPLVLTVRRKYFPSAELAGQTDLAPWDLGQELVQVVDEKIEAPEGVPLEDAEVIFTGGRGMGGSENFAILRDLAAALRGAVGASRAAVDEGWVPQSMQIGQTGKIVAPKLYIAVGVSGASQHLAGIANAKCVVAINRDEEASIYKRAQFGICADYRKVLPELLTVLRQEV